MLIVFNLISIQATSGSFGEILFHTLDWIFSWKFGLLVIKLVYEGIRNDYWYEALNVAYCCATTPFTEIENDSNQLDGRHVMLPSGELHVLSVRNGDENHLYHCRILIRPNGETQTSATAGRIVLLTGHSSDK